MTLRDKIAHTICESRAVDNWLVQARDYELSDAILSVIAESAGELEWDWPWEHGLICRAKTPIGTYSIHQDEDSAGGALLMYLHLTDEGDCTRYAVEWHAYVEPQEFQAEAQIDYTRRILSAIGFVGHNVTPS